MIKAVPTPDIEVTRNLSPEIKVLKTAPLQQSEIDQSEIENDDEQNLIRSEYEISDLKVTTSNTNVNEECNRIHFLTLQGKSTISPGTIGSLYFTLRDCSVPCLKNQHNVKINFMGSLLKLHKDIMMIDKEMKISVHNPKSYNLCAPYQIEAQCDVKSFNSNRKYVSHLSQENVLQIFNLKWKISMTFTKHFCT